MRQTDLDKAPYFDDFNPNDRFHQVLFKAGQTVQSRELNELQDILQGQIESLGSHLFKNGSVVIPGNFVVQTQLLSVSYTVADSGQASEIVSGTGLFMRGATTGVEAKIMLSVAGSPLVSFCDVTKSGTNGTTKSFQNGEVLTVYSVDTSNVEHTIATSVVATQGKGSYATVDDGIYFVRGMMVRCTKETIILNSTQDVSLRVGFTVTEDIITSVEDPSLLSNALGEPNYRSAGADRLKLTLSLSTRTLEQEDPNFLELAKIVDGNVESLLARVQYNELEKVLAQRTYEESGNYSVNQSQVELREHLLDGDNGGVYPESAGGDPNKLVVVVSPSVHYVYGYRVENSTPRFVEMDKSRDTDIANNAVTAAIYGNLVEVNQDLGAPIVDFNTVYTIRDSGDVQIGTFRVASIQKQSNDSVRLVARNIVFNAGKSWANAVAVRATKGAASFKGILTVKGLLIGGQPSLILPLPYSGVKSLESGGQTDTTYQVTSDFSVSLNASGVGVATAASGSSFTGQFSQFIVSLQNGTVGEIPTTYALVGSPVGSGLQIDCGVTYANASVKLVAITQKASSSPRSKKLTTTTQNITTTVGVTKYNLLNVDALRLVAVFLEGNDVTAQFTLDGGQRDSTYEFGSVTSSIPLPNSSIQVEYEYFAHGPGDYFCVDSYIDVDYDDIPTFIDSVGNVFDLSDSLDFRKSSTGSGYNAGDIASPYSSVQSDVEFYLPRFNSLYVTSEGNFGVVNGISSQNSNIPVIPENSMRLTDFFLPPWTPSIDSVNVFIVNNKRYTMRDIGKLETRIENLEYYTSLSQLETDASNIQVIDPITGNDRFKNGIFADPMTDFRMLNPSDPESFCSIDDQAGRLRPLVDSVGINFSWVSGGTNKDKMISSAMGTGIAFDVQPFATKQINVNPYSVFSWAGFVNLTPSRDFWVDTVYAPDKIVNQTENHRGAEREGVVYGKWTGLTGGAFAFRFNQQRQVTTTSFTEWTTSSTSESTLRTELIPYMRSIEIQFKGSGLRPFTRVYPWFSNRMVADHCKPTGGQYAQALVTDAQGNVSGTFLVPNNAAIRFNTGVSSFILVDSSANMSDPLQRTTFANATFESGGSLVTKQRTTVQVRHLGVTTRSELEYRKVDPIAQSFSVDQAGGLFLEGVDIFFATKAKNIPVTVEIREMQNGLPTHEVVARTVLNPSQVFVSTTADVATRFNFAPVPYLREGGEYAVVILANTQEYNAYIAEMGERVINSTQTIATQPVTGVFFTSSNGSTWSAQQLQDLKYNLIRANFNLTEQVLLFRPNMTAQGRILPSNPLTSASGSTVITVNCPFHGTQAGDTVTLSGVIASNGISSQALNKVHQVTEVVDFNTFRVVISEQAALNGSFGGAEVVCISRNYMNLVNINIDHSKFEGTSIKFEMRYRFASGRSMSPWVEFTPGADILLAQEGTFYDSDDMEVRVTVLSNGVLSPQVDEHGFTAIINAFYLSETEQLMNYVSRDIFLDNPSTSGTIFISSLLSTGATMKLYVKYITDSETGWIEVPSTNPISNGTPTFVENEFSLGEVSDFIGLRLKVALTGPRSNPPLIKDIRGAILA
ncbi:MAG: DUF4815 domain-containing protein [Aeromonas popoffii]|uniref:DUF4815 domain-containing protein n=1 Tax=Aeromonas popoffii TaxID=70856 RepID=UPI003F345818